jgi:MFS family permease
MDTRIDSREAWGIAIVTLLILATTFGAPHIVNVALKQIAADLNAPRSVPALAAALCSFGTGAGGILMGWLAQRLGIRAVALTGGICAAAGLAVSTLSTPLALYAGYGLLLGLLGNGAMNAPLMTYVSFWFDRRRGTALALITSGQYIAGTIWPSLFERGIEAWGWQFTSLAYACVELAIVLPVALLFLRPAPQPARTGSKGAGPAPGSQVLGLSPNTALALMTIAIFLCCIPMAQPSVHLVSFCTDIGLAPARGAAMLSVLLACAFVSRQLWGWVGDRIGGLRTVLAGSACQALALSMFLTTQDEPSLFAIAAAFGLGFGGIVPSYVLAARDLFPASEASWRIPVLLFGGLIGMATGGWMGGYLYDLYGSYRVSFELGVAANLANLVLVAFLVTRRRHTREAWA